MNHWKAAFFILLSANVVLNGLLFFLFFGAGFTILDSSVSLTHLRDGYADCETHRNLLHRLAEQQVRKPNEGTGQLKMLTFVNGNQHLVDLDDFDIRYDAEGRYVGSAYGGSTTPNFWNLPPTPKK